MSLRALFVASALLLPTLAATAAHAQDESCLGTGAGGGDVSDAGECDGSDAIFCSAGTLVRVPCAALGSGAPVGECRVFGTFGSWCAFDDGDACLVSVDGTPTQFACTTPSSGCIDDVCTPGSFACTPDNVDDPPQLSCFDGDSVDTGCAPWSQRTVVACEVVTPGSVCAEGGPDGASCIVADCGSAGAGSCDGTTAITCSDGVEASRENCATFGQACVQDAPGQSPSCVTADTRCGPSGQGACAGTTATICVGGQFDTETNCAAVGLVCGPVAGTGRIGCIEPGAAEGEGEGGGATEGEGEAAPECERDSDCDDDEECNDGECEEDDGPVRGGGGGEPIQPAPLCAEAGTLPISLSAAALLGLALRRRRRR